MPSADKASPPSPAVAEPLSAEEFQAAQVEEWGEYVAVNVITINGVRAFNRGDPVPKSHVERGVVSKDDVAKPESEAGKAALSGTES